MVRPREPFKVKVPRSLFHTYVRGRQMTSVAVSWPVLVHVVGGAGTFGCCLVVWLLGCRVPS